MQLPVTGSCRRLSKLISVVAWADSGVLVPDNARCLAVLVLAISYAVKASCHSPSLTNILQQGKADGRARIYFFVLRSDGNRLQQPPLVKPHGYLNTLLVVLEACFLHPDCYIPYLVPEPHRALRSLMTPRWPERQSP